ncbi:MAG: cation transporter, partial [Chromatiales bacterium]
MSPVETEKPTESNTTHRLSIGGMSCAGCVGAVEQALRGVPGVVSAAVSLGERTARVQGSADVVALVDAVRAAGYEAAELRGLADEQAKEAGERAHYQRLLRQFWAAAALGLPLMVVGMGPWAPGLAGWGQVFWILGGLATLAILALAGRHYYIGAWKAFRVHNANMDTLIALGTGAAWLYSMLVALWPALVPEQARHVYFEAAVVIVALVNLGQALEMRARGKTSEAIRRLIGLQPRSARVVRNGEELDVPIEDVGLDETVRVRPGEKIPVD